MTQVPPNQIIAFNALLRTKFGAFLHKTVEDLNPGIPFQSNWHIRAIDYALDRMVAGETKHDDQVDALAQLLHWVATSDYFDYSQLDFKSMFIPKRDADLMPWQRDDYYCDPDQLY